MSEHYTFWQAIRALLVRLKKPRLYLAIGGVERGYTSTEVKEVVLLLLHLNDRLAFQTLLPI